MTILTSRKGELHIGPAHPTVRAADFLAGKDPYGLRYIAYYRALERGEIGT